MHPSLFASILASQVMLPGTQPNELTILPEPSSTCACHDAFDFGAVTEPAQSYKATMMALAGRDPVFKAAFRVAVRDRPEMTDLCLRCHTPMAWLSGRSTPSDGSALIREDLESVTCDICHRMVPSNPPLIGDGQFTLSQNTAKRAARGNGPVGGHSVVQSDYQSSSEMCGVCHSLFNPLEEARSTDGSTLGFAYYEQRTYEEWADSTFAMDGVGCIDCHMKRTNGAAARDGMMYPDLAVHALVGGNSFAPQAVLLLTPNLGITSEVAALQGWVDQSLSEAATLAVTSTVPDPLVLTPGEDFAFDVRLTNETGHKLPSGYPEGRRVYLEVALNLDDRDPMIVSGAWDSTTGDLIPDPQLRTYETAHGRYEAGTSTRTHHLAFANQVLLDTRIPPAGFDPSAADMHPVGRDYGDPPYRHFDDATFVISAPDLDRTTTGTVTVRAMYQILDGTYVDFLLQQAAGSTEAADLATAWENLARAPPRPMQRVSFPITIDVPERPDAGTTDSGGTEDAGSTQPDAGSPVVDAGTNLPEPPEEEGCGCTTPGGRGRGATPAWLLAGLAWMMARRRKG